MRDEILEYLKDQPKARELMEINDALKLKNVSDLEKLQKEIEKLVQEGLVHITRKDKYLLMEYCQTLFPGKVEIAKNGYGFLLQEDGEDIFISKENLNGAINNDFVLVDVFTRHNKKEGKVIKILNREVTRVIGEILFVKDKPTIILDNKKLDIEIISGIN